MSHPKVSVIVPCYNYGHYIEETIDSVLAQTFQDFEIVITDDCSNDGTTPAKIKEVAKKDKRIKVISLPENKGLPSARNVAIAEAQGTYILPLDADDKIAPECLEKATDAMETEKGDIIYWNATFFGAKSGVREIPENAAEILPFKPCILPCCLYKKSDWEKYDGYNDNMREGWEDWDFFLYFFGDRKKFIFLDDALLYYREGHASLSDDLFVKGDRLKKQIRKNHPNIFTLKDYYFTANYFRYVFFRLPRKIKNIRRKIIQIRFNKKEKVICILGFNLINKKT